MRNILRLCAAGIALLVLAVAGNAMADALTPEEVPQLAVPRMSKAPVIDGAINAEEWKESVAISGVVDQGNNMLISRPTTYFLAWDAGHFYLASRTYIRAEYKPRAAGRSPGMANVGDDGMELVVKPMGKNLQINNQQASFKFFVNSLGFIGDNTKLDLGQQLKSWMPDFKIASRLTAPGSAPNGGHWLEIEMSAIPADFELKGDNQAGDAWKLMLGYNHLAGGWLQARIPCMGSYFEAGGGGYCQATLVDNLPAVKMTMDSLANLSSDGTASLKIQAFNPGAEAKLAVSVTVADKIAKNETLSVPANGSAEFTLNEKLAEDVKKGKAQVSVKLGDKTLLSYTTFFTVGYRNDVLAGVKPADPNKFPFSAVFNPSRNWLQLSADSYYLPDPKAAKLVEYKVLPAAGGKPLAEGVIDTQAEWYFSRMLDLPGIAPGEYKVEAVMTLADGKKLDPANVTFVKKDEAKEFAVWWNKPYGNAERVLPPFTALKQEKDAVTCLGRSYALNALGLPKSISSQGKEIMAAPARLVVVAGGKETALNLDSAVKVTDAKDWRISFAGEAKGAGLAFSAKGWIEQDGLVYVDLTYGPDGKSPVAVEALRLEYPLAAEWAESLVCFGPGANFSSKTGMVIPQGAEAKDGQIWSTLVTGRPGSMMTVGSFYPTVWIGGDRRGFMWWADNDKGWFPDDDIPAHDALRAGNTVVFRNNIIGKPVTLEKASTISFSYNASPFKPLLKGWRTCAATEDGTFFQPFRGVRNDSKTDKKVKEGPWQQGWINPESRYPEEWAELWAKQKNNPVEAGFAGADTHAKNNQWRSPYAARNGINFTHMSFTLEGYGRRSIEDNLYAYFGGDWDHNFDKSWLDYSMYLFDRAFREGGVRSTYWDITFPNTHNSVLSGHAYKLPDGRVQCGFSGWDYRRFFMRLQAAAIDNNLYPFCNGSHSTNDYVLVAMPWLDAVLDGERNWNLDIADQDWVDYYPIERMRSISSPHNWGTTLCWMGNLDSIDKAKVNNGKRIQGMWVWMHDSWLNPYIPQLGGMPAPVLDWGINSTAAEYLPYWRNPIAISADKDILVSAWKLPGRVMLGVFNYNRKDAKDAVVKLDLAGLGLAAKDGAVLAASDLFLQAGDPAAALDAASGTLSVKALPPHTIRLVGVRLTNNDALAKMTEQLKALGLQPEKATALAAKLADYGAVEPGTSFGAAGQSAEVKAEGEAKVALWKIPAGAGSAKPDRILLAVTNDGDKPVQAKISIDLEKLGLLPQLQWQEYIGTRDFILEEKEQPAQLDFHNRSMVIKSLKPHSSKLIGIRLH